MTSNASFAGPASSGGNDSQTKRPIVRTPSRLTAVISANWSFWSQRIASMP